MMNRYVMVCLTSMAVSSFVHAGDLNPPAGPVAASGRFGPRTEVNAVNTPGNASSLFMISQPGSYYLGANIVGEPLKQGILIVSSGVTLDLMGFDLVGVSRSFDGILVLANVVNIQIYNGSLRGWGAVGVNANSATNVSLRNLLVQGNSGHGMFIGGGAIIEHCVAEFNVGFGINASVNAVITGCSARFNTAGGIRAWSYSSVTACISNGNFGPGFEVGIGCTIADCSATLNEQDGFLVSDYSTVTACAATKNGDDGIEASLGCVIIGCAAGENGDDGIYAPSFGVVMQCNLVANTGDGIEIFAGGRVVDNNCQFNGNDSANGDGAGIHVTSTECLIEGNNVAFNDRGIDVDLFGNLIIRNSAVSNAVDYDIVAGNSVGQILNVSGVTITSSNPWANISY